MSYDARDFFSDVASSVKPGERWRLRSALSEAVWYFRYNDLRCIFRLHSYEFFKRANWARDDIDEGMECVRCGKEGEPPSWKYWNWFWATRLGDAYISWDMKRQPVYEPW